MSGSAHRRGLGRGLLLAFVVVAALTVKLSSGAATLTDPCSSPGWNVITCENSKPGTPSATWSAGGAGDATLQGFSTDISVDHGQTVSFKITDTNGSTGVGGSYHIDIYRVGYYQGNGARLQATIPTASVTATNQGSCSTEATTGLIDCGNWTVSASWAVPAAAVSGLYFANLVRDTNGANSHIYFIVRDDERHAPLLFQTSDETWEAYNAYGGNSLYVGTAPTSNGRAWKVSYNRPLTTGNNSPRNEPLYAEYPMIRFLERNGYDVSYFSEVDTARSAAEILNHKTFMSVGHDEYWSAEQRNNVVAARNAGVNLAFFSANEIFWKTRWAASITPGAQSWRTVVCYKESKEPGAIDPADPPTTTGAWRDPRFGAPADGGKPENAVSGQMYMVDAIRDDAIAVPYAYSKLRFWSNTSIASLAPGQTATLPTGTLGYEWDEDLDNGSRPAGLIDMSSVTVPVTTLVTDSTGQAEGSGNATHHLTLYRASSGALVFGAGTVQWSFGLDNNHTAVQDTSNPAPSTDMQQATVNLLADMSAQPATIQAGLATATKSTDTTPPTSTITYPAPSTLLDPTQSLTVTGTASDTGGGVVAGVEVSTDGGATWHPATGTTSWSYTFTPGSFGQRTIQSRATDDSANIQSTPASVTVTVGSCPCNIFGQTTPANPSITDAAPYELGVKFRSDVAGFVTGIRFYKGANNTGTHVGHLWTSTGTQLAAATFTNESATGWQQVNFATPVSINANTTYVASYTAPRGNYAADRPFFGTNGVDVPPLHALQDGVDGPNGVYASGGNLFPTSSFQSTNYYVDVVFNNANPPAVNTVSPAAGKTDVASSTAVTASFTQAMDASTITGTTMTLQSSGGALVPATVAYNAATSTATLTPTQPLTLSTTYTATVKGGASGVKSSGGTAMTADYTWSFTTATPVACPCTIFPAAATPNIASAFDTTSNELGVKFRSDQNGYIRGIRFYKGPGNTGTHIGHLWSSTGAMLAEITFTNETASGWQQVDFPRPVAITANTTYVASYVAPNGGYALDRPYFGTGVDRSPMHALADGVSGPNGVFAAGGGFPTQGSSASNYWVDAVFDTDGTDRTPPMVSSVSPAAGATAIAASHTASVAFNEPIDPLSVTTSTVLLRDPSNATVPASVSYDSGKQSAILTPNAPLALSTTYTLIVKGGAGGVSDVSGNPLAADYTSTFTTGTPAACPCNVLDSNTPTVASTTDTSPTEVGMKFRSDIDGYVTGIRFYKGVQNTGTHVGYLWSAAGILMGSATFTNETATGWQQVTFSSPIAIRANTTYVAAYLAPNGGYALDRPYFTNWVDRPPLHALAEGVEGSNGVFAAGQAFPNQAFAASASNYWVDPIFSTVADTTPPTVTSTSPAANATGVIRTTTVQAVFSELLNSGSVTTTTFQLRDSSGTAVAATVTYNGPTTTATLTPSAALTPGVTYTATVSGGSGGVKDTSGNALVSNYSWSFTISSDVTPPTTTITCNSGSCANWIATTPVTVALQASDNAGGAGVDKTRYTTDGSDPTSSSSATVYSGPFTVAATTTTVRYSSTDLVGNVETPTTTQVRIDTTPPSAPTLSFGAFTNASASGSTVYYNAGASGGFTVTGTSTDAESGIASVSYPSLGSGWTQGAGGSYSFTAGAIDPVEPNNVTATNNAGLASAATSFTVTADGSAPTTTLTCNGAACPAWSTSSPVTLALNGSDTGSGVSATYYTTDGSDPSVLHGSVYVGSFTVAATTTIKFRSYDNVGNAEAIHTQQVGVDTTAPSAPSLAFGGLSGAATVGGVLYFNPASSGAFTVTASSTDPESGVTSYSYPNLGSGWTGTGGSYSFAAGATDPTEPNNVTATNNAGLTSTPTSFTVTADTTAPATTITCNSAACSSGWYTTTPVSVALSASDGGSGVKQIRYSTDGSPPSLTYTSPISIAATTTLKFAAVDNVGNTEATKSQLVQIDTTAPSAPVLTLTAGTGTAVTGQTVFYSPAAAGGFSVVASSTDAESGVASYAYPNFGLGWSNTGGSYSFAAGALQPSPANVTATNNAGLTSAPTSFSAVSDSTAPTTTIVCSGGCAGWHTTSPVTITLTASDGGGSGLDRILYSTDGSTPSLLYTAPFTLASTATVKYAAYDRVGNLETLKSQTVQIDTTPPSAPSLTLGGTSGSAALTGGVLYFNPASSGGFSVTASSTDPESGIATFAYPSLGSGWTGTGGSYSFAAGATDPTEPNNVTATNNAGLTSTPTSFTVTADTTAPATTITCNSAACSSGWYTTTPVSVALSASDGGSGVKQIRYSTDGTAPSVVYSVPISIGATTTLKFAAVDNVGNTEATKSQLVQIDTTAPSAPTLTLGGTSGGAALTGGVLYFNPASSGAFTVAPSSTDGESGVAGYNYPSLGTGWTRVNGAYSFGAGAVDPAEPNNVTAVNNAGLTSAPTSFTVTADATAPTSSIACSGGCAGWHNATTTVTLSASDGGSGVAKILYSTDGTAPSVVYSVPISIGATTTLKFAAVDNVGNTEATKSQLVQVDTTAPSAPVLTLSAGTGTAVTGQTVFYSPAAAGGFSVAGSSNDAESGVATYTYPALGVGWSVNNGAYTFAAGAPDPTEPNNVTATNNAGLTSAPTSFTVTADSTAPTTSVACTGGCAGWHTTSPVTITLSSTDGSGSGIDRILYSTSGGTPSTLYTAPFTVAATTTVTFAAYDRVGNLESTKSQFVQVDTTAPSAPSLTLGGTSGGTAVTGGVLYFNPASSGGFSVTASSTDPESGIATFAYPSLGTGWAGSGGTYTYTTGATDPTEPNNVTATNNAGLTSTPTSFTVAADTTAPATTATCNSAACSSGWYTTTPVSVALSASDGASGVAKILYSTDGTAPSLTYTGPISIAATTTLKFAAVDKVGNNEATKSQLVQIDVNAPTAPTLTLGGTTGNAAVTGGVVYFNPAGAGGFTVTATATDGDSGIDHYTYPSLGSGWTNTTSGAYSFVAGAVDPAEPNNVTATNGAGTTGAPTSFTVTADTTAPATTATCNSAACSSGWYTTTPVSVALSASDGGSGVKQIRYSTDGSPPSLTYTGPISIAATTTLKFAAVDNVGNTEATKSQLVQIDTTAPTPPTLTLGGTTGNAAVTGGAVYFNPAASGGFTVTASSTDSGSGVDHYTYPSLGSGWTNTTSGAYSFVAGASDPAEPNNVTATNVAGLTGAPTSFRVDADSTAPTTTATCNGAACSSGWYTSSPISFALAASDGGSGVDRILYSTDGTAPSLLYTAPLAITSTTNVRFAAYDRVGNLEATNTQLVQVDTTPPSAPSLAVGSLSGAALNGGVLYFNPATSGGFTITPSSTDAESGIAGYNYPSLGTGWTRVNGAYYFAAGAVDPAEPNNVTATNKAGLTSAPTSLTITADTTAPTTTLTCNGAACSSGWYTTSPVSVALSAVDGGSGLASIRYSLDGSAPSLPYTGALSINATTTVTYTAIDNVGNSITASLVVRVDTTAPSTPALSFSSLTNASVTGSTVFYRSAASGGFTVAASSSDAESGVASYAFPSLGNGWSGPGGAYTFAAGAQQPLGASSVTATNNAGLTSAPAQFTVLRDDAAPTTSIKCNGGACGGGFASAAVSVTLAASDGTGSGVVKTVYTLDGSEPSPIHGTVYLGGFTLTSSTTVKFRSYDAVGNEEAVGSQLVNVDTTPPAVPVLTLTAPSAGEYATGTTLYYNPSGTNTGTFTVNAATSDPESGIAKLNFPALAGATGGGDTTTSSSTYTWNATTSASGPQSVTAYNGSGLTSSATFTVTPDTSAPSGGSVAYPDGYQSGGAVSIATTDGTDGGAGINAASRTLERQTAPLAGGTCGTWSNWSSVTSPDTVPDATCARYRYRVADLVGNVQIYTSSNVVKVDAGTPSTPALTLSGASAGEYVSSTTLYYNPSGSNSGSFTVTASTSAASGIARVTFPSLAGMTGGGDVTTTPYAATYGWTPSSAASGAQTVTARSNAGATSSATFTVTPDSGAPTGQTAALVGGPWFTGTSISIATTNGNDATSGVDPATGLIERASATLANGTCGTFSAYSGSYTSPDTTVASGNCYRYRYSIADRVGNRSTPAETGVAMVDTSAPTTPSLAFGSLTHASVSGSTVYYNANTSGGFTVTSTASDPQSGIAATSFPSFGSGWSGTGGAYTFAAGAADPAEPNNVVTTNGAGLNSSPAAFTVTADGDAPTGGSISYGDGYRTSASVSITLANGSDALSGVDPASAILQRESATMTEGACGTYDAWTTIATAPALSYTDTSVTSGRCYAYRYVVSDKVGNAATSTTTSVAKIDTDFPTATLADPGANLRQTVNLVSTTGDTGGSGLATVTYQRSSAGGWITIPAAWDTTTATDGLYDLRVVVTDRAGNSTTSAVVTGRRVDNTPPSATIADPGASLRRTVTLSSVTSDSGSGVASVTYQRSDPSGWVTIPATWDTTTVTDGLYDLRVVVVDVAGNQAIATVTGRRVDNTAPSSAMGSLASVIRATVTLGSTTSDSGSGIASVAYERQQVGSVGWVATPATFDTTTVPDGDYDIHVVATDAAGNSTTSAPVRTHVDNTSPRPTTVTPANGSSSVATNVAVTATFPRAMLSSSITSSSFTLSSSGGAVPATVSYNSSTLTATLTPTAALAESTTYTATLTTAVTAQDNASLYQPYTWSFSTGVMPPTVAATSPGNGATGVSTTVTPSATFSRPMDPTTIDATSVTLSSSSGPVTATVAYDSTNRTVTLTPSAPLANGVTYTMQLSSAIKSQDGNALAPTSFTFTTVGGAPTITSMAPAAGATGVATATAVAATFNRDMKPSTLTTSTVTLVGPSGAVAATVSYDATTYTVKLTPSAPLAAGTTYTATVSGSAQSSAGVPMGSDSTWTFTTTAGPEVRSTTPADGATGVSMSVVPTVQMSMAIDAATVTTTNVKLLRADTTSVAISVAYNATTHVITITPSPGNPLDYSNKMTIRLETGITAGGVAMSAPFTSTFTTTGTGVATRIDAGSTTAYTATNGNVFSADTGFIGGATHTVTNTITGTTDPTLYKTERTGTWQYSIPVPNGTYDLKLHFVELSSTACNQRVFSVDVLNTSTVNDVSNLDIFCEVGANKPDIKTITGVLVSARSLRLKAVAGSVGTPEIAAIEIIPHPPTATPTTPAAGATGVSVATTVAAVFSQAMDSTSLTASTFTLTGPGGASVAATVAYDSTSKTVTLTPTAPLAHAASYTARLDPAIRDSFGLVMGTPATWTFTTG